MLNIQLELENWRTGNKKITSMSKKKNYVFGVRRGIRKCHTDKISNTARPGHIGVRGKRMNSNTHPILI